MVCHFRECLHDLGVFMLHSNRLQKRSGSSITGPCIIHYDGECFGDSNTNPIGIYSLPGKRCCRHPCCVKPFLMQSGLLHPRSHHQNLFARLVVEQNPEIQPAVGSFMPSGRATSQKSLGFLRPSTWVAPATCFRSEATAFEQGVRRKLFEARFPTRYLKSNPMTDKTSWTRCLQTTPISVEVSETWCCVRTSCTK